MSQKRKRNRYEEINSIRWYYYLVPNEDCIALLDVLDSPEEKFIVCATLPTDNPKKPIHLFAAFNSVLDFVNHIKAISRDRWYFFEVILGDNPQKLYFDIDVKSEEVEGNMDQFVQPLLDDLVDRVVETFSQFGYELDLAKNILLFSSNSDKKRSYHLIVNGFCVSNNLENRALAEEILKGISMGCRDHVDPGVYSSKQQFRLYLSQKPHSGRPKIFLDKWTHRGVQIQSTVTQFDPNIAPEMIEGLLLTKVFLASTITYVKGCISLPILFDTSTSESKIKKSEYEENLEVTEEIISEIAQKVDPMLFKIYKIKGAIGPLIILTRKEAAHCSLCRTKEREVEPHTSENAFLRVSESGRVYFYCRRNANQSKFLTTVSVPADVELQETHASSTIQKYLQSRYPPSAITPHALVRAIAAGKV